MPITSNVNTLSAADLYFRNVTSGYVVVLRGHASFSLRLLSVKLATTFGNMDCLCTVCMNETQNFKTSMYILTL